MKTKTSKASGLKVKFGSVFPALILVGAILSSPSWGIQRCAAGTGFPTTATDGTTFSIGVFQIVVDPNFNFLFAPATTYPGYSPSSGVLTSPVMFDGNTMIGESASYNRGSQSFIPPVAVGTPAGYPLNTTYSNILGYTDYALIPSAFSSAPSGVDQIFTEIEDLNLTAANSTGVSNNCPDSRVPNAYPSTVVSVVAGPMEIPNLPLNRRSIGMVQQITAGPPTASDFPGQSFFNMFVQVTLPPVPTTVSLNDFPPAGAVLYNDASDPLLIINTNVTSVPPAATYIHGQTTAVPIKFLTSHPPYWAAGDVLGYLTLAGHGVFTNDNPTISLPPPPCLAAESGGLLDQVLGPVGSPIASPPVPWLRPNDLFPSPGSTYDSSVNTFVDPSTGHTNVLDDTVSFTTSGHQYTIRDLSLSELSNSIAPPTLNNSSSYNDSYIPVLTLQVAKDSSTFAIYGSNPNQASMLITNIGTSGSTTLYATELQQFSALINSSGGLMLRTDPTNPSLGQHTIAPDPRGYRVSSFFDVSLQLSDDGGATWFNGNKSIRLSASMPPAVPGSVFASLIGNNVVVRWQNNFTLQSTTNLLVPFTDVAGPVTSGSYTNPMTASVMFYRLRQ